GNWASGFPMRCDVKTSASACVARADSVEPLYANPMLPAKTTLSNQPAAPGCLQTTESGRIFGPCSVNMLPADRMLRVSAMALIPPSAIQTATNVTTSCSFVDYILAEV